MDEEKAIEVEEEEGVEAKADEKRDFEFFCDLDEAEDGVDGNDILVLLLVLVLLVEGR